MHAIDYIMTASRSPMLLNSSDANHMLSYRRLHLVPSNKAPEKKKTCLAHQCVVVFENEMTIVSLPYFIFSFSLALFLYNPVLALSQPHSSSLIVDLSSWR